MFWFHNIVTITDIMQFSTIKPGTVRRWYCLPRVREIAVAHSVMIQTL